MVSYRASLCVVWVLSAVANADCGLDGDGQSTCPDQATLLQAKVLVDVSADVIDEVELAPGTDRATTKFLEGVPIYKYHTGTRRWHATIVFGALAAKAMDHHVPE